MPSATLCAPKNVLADVKPESVPASSSTCLQSISTLLVAYPSISSSPLCPSSPSADIQLPLGSAVPLRQLSDRLRTCLAKKPRTPQEDLRNARPILRLPLRSEERVSRHRLDLAFHRLSGPATSASRLRRTSRHLATAPLIQHRSPASSHHQGSEEPVRSLSSRSRSSQVNEPAIQAVQISGELCTSLPARPLSQLGPFCRPLFACFEPEFPDSQT